MKKAYINPETLVISVATSAMVCASITGTSGADGLGYGGGTSDGNITTGNSRHSSLWDDDED